MRRDHLYIDWAFSGCLACRGVFIPWPDSFEPSQVRWRELGDVGDHRILDRRAGQYDLILFTVVRIEDDLSARHLRLDQNAAEPLHVAHVFHRE